ncbi:MAG: alpha amylase C-terminal domain-containing protein [Salinivirgaceae bacterium]|nr:alpha amylase C-terminal domain-containing protein [Salinivirgaceae bacterium]
MSLPEIVKKDEWLSPYADVIKHRITNAKEKEKELLGSNFKSLYDFANGHNYFGCQIEKNSIIFREWIPNAKEVFLFGELSNWEKSDKYKFSNIANGIFELKLEMDKISHGDLYKLHVNWEGGSGERIPAWATRVVQDEKTKIFSAQFWNPKNKYQWQHKQQINNGAPMIYEAHIGMAGEDEKVSTFREFKDMVLPRIVKLGYNTIQFMAIQEHPYYGSFGYHVSSFFAASSRFGTPEELKELIDEAHKNGLRVIMDIVHSHAVKNELEGLGNYDGTRYQFFHDGPKGVHPAWDSYCFNYSKNEVLHFLLSNVKFWLEEYNFDGFRFDGVTSMLYQDHGLGKDFVSYDNYFDNNQDEDAISYLMLANKLMHQINPKCLSIAEEMSGYPGLAYSETDGGIGFDYRLAMGIPDFWIKNLKDKTDDEWDMGNIFHELTSKRAEEKTISYTESHDQALVGDKTIAFRLMDKEMYHYMKVEDSNLIIDRGIALHKMIRLLTCTTAGGGYLNFMGNEFGHPEWIDFPRVGNNWSHKYAARQWSLVDREDLKYKYLNVFDTSMIHLMSRKNLAEVFPCNVQNINNADKVICFSRSDLLFIFNFHPSKSYADYGIPVSEGKYKYIMGTDELPFGGFGRVDESQSFYSLIIDGTDKEHQIKVYIPSRTAIILEKQAIPKVYHKIKKQK